MRVGPTAASVLSILEPVVTVGPAFAVFGESLRTAQPAGASLVLLMVEVQDPGLPPDPTGYR